MILSLRLYYIKVWILVAQLCLRHFFIGDVCKQHYITIPIQIFAKNMYFWLFSRNIDKVFNYSFWYWTDAIAIV